MVGIAKKNEFTKVPYLLDNENIKSFSEQILFVKATSWKLCINKKI